jgi:hypothetical protein
MNMKKIQAMGELLATEDPPEGEGRLILKAYFDAVHEIMLGPYPSSDRDQLIDFFELTVTLLRRIGAGDPLVNRLMTYAVALRDRDRGVTHPVLKVKSGKPPVSLEVGRLQACLAIALDYLIRAKTPIEDRKKVARIQGIERLLSGRAKSADARKRAQKIDAYTSIKRWRTTLHGGKSTNEAAREAWDASRKKLPSIDGPQGLRAEAARLIQFVRNELAAADRGRKLKQ